MYTGGYQFYDLGLDNFKLYKKKAKAEGREFAAQDRKIKRPQSMVFDLSQGRAPPKFEEVFGGKNGGTKSSRRDVSYREVTKTIGGVVVPKRPIEPDNCCMSGCINCVWDLFGEDMEEWKTKTKEAATALEKQGDNIKEQWPRGFDPPPSYLADKYIPEELVPHRGKHKVKNKIPPGLAVFQEFERKKKLQRQNKLKQFTRHGLKTPESTLSSDTTMSQDTNTTERTSSTTSYTETRV